MRVKGEAVTSEVLVAKLLQMPKEVNLLLINRWLHFPRCFQLNDESSDDTELVPEIVRVEEALGKVSASMVTITIVQASS